MVEMLLGSCTVVMPLSPECFHTDMCDALGDYCGFGCSVIMNACVPMAVSADAVMLLLPGACESAFGNPGDLGVREVDPFQPVAVVEQSGASCCKVDGI